MAVQVRPLTLSIRELELSILREARAATQEDGLIAKYGSNETGGCVLYSIALSKKLLGLHGVGLGTDPRKKEQLPIGEQIDWDDEYHRHASRYMADKSDDPNIQAMTQEQRKEAIKHAKAQVDRTREWAEQADAEYDPDAWAKVLEVNDWISRRCKQLDVLGLVIWEGVTDLPQELANMPENRLPEGFRSMPGIGTLQPTLAGMRFLSRGDRLEELQGQGGVHPLDRRVRVVERH